MKTNSVFLLTTILITSCSTLKFYEDNDSYVNIRKERKEKLEQLALEKKKQEERQKFIQDSIAREEEKINNNPYYKEPNYSKDDYYDYEYAARIKRFYNPVMGLGYYDNWYTNSGFYGAPNFGNSIYMGYGFNTWTNPYYSFGLGTCWGNPFYYNTWNTWGYSPWYYNPYWNFGYSPYWYNWNNPYYPYFGYYPYYYNSLDVNSMTYAPRTSHEGFNSKRTVNNISNENRIANNSTIVSPELNTPKFDESARPKPIEKFEPKQVNAVNVPIIRRINTNPSSVQSNIFPRNINLNTSVSSNNSNENTLSSPRGNNQNIGRPIISKPEPVNISPKENNFNFQNNSMQRGGGGSGNNGGFSSPKSGGSIGRPR